jgi:hypothetical protein
MSKLIIIVSKPSIIASTNGVTEITKNVSPGVKETVVGIEV